MSKLLEEKARIEADLLAKNPRCAQFLYHGNSNSTYLRKLTPHFSHTAVNDDRGEYVFASEDFLTAALYTLKSSDDDFCYDLQRVGGFRKDKQCAMYAMVGDYAALTKKLSVGHVYGVYEHEFFNADRYGSEKIALKPVRTRFAVAVDSPVDLMESGVQIFSIRDEYTAGEIDENLSYMVQQSAQEYAFREILLPNKMISWVNKDLGIPIPDGPMADW